MYLEIQNYREHTSKAQMKEAACLRGVEVGTRVAFNRNYCVLTVKALGFMRAQVVADMRGVVTKIPKGVKPHCLVKWEGIDAPYETHMAHLEPAEYVVQTSHGRYLRWIDY